jgi:hypothetical protein
MKAAGKDHEDESRNRGKDTSGQQESPIDPKLAGSFVKLERERLQAALGDKAKGKEEIARMASGN